MDSPEFVPPSFLTRKKVLEKEAPREDSGYVTITPNLSEYTRSSNEISDDTSAGHPFYHFDMFESTRLETSQTPGGNLANFKMDTEQGVSFLDNSPNIFSSTKLFAATTFKNSSSINESYRTCGRNLLRQNALEMEWSPEVSRIPCGSTPSGDNHHSIVEPMNNIMLTGDCSILADNISSLMNFKGSNASSTIDIYNAKEVYDIHKTPRKQGIKKNHINKYRKTIKKMSFSTQSLGTPEKNRLLYSQLVTVTPTKCTNRSRDKNRITPEKEKSPNSKSKVNLFPKKRKNYCGVEKVDIIKSLHGRHHIVEQIFGDLSDGDLINASRVSNTWLSQCMKSNLIRRRLSKIKQTIRENKENVSRDSSFVNLSRSKKITFQKTNTLDLVDMQNVKNILSDQKPTQLSPPVSPGKRRFHMFTKAASQDAVNQLRSCTRCQKPARLKDKWATCLTCDFTFCILCHNEKKYCQSSCPNAIKAASPSKDSPIKTITPIEKRRRNLRRLVF